MQIWCLKAKHPSVRMKKAAAAAAAAKSLQSCPTLCDPRDGSPPGSLVPGILQARTLEWVAISFPNAWNWKVRVKSCPTLSNRMDCSLQAPPSVGFARREHWSGVPLPSPTRPQWQSRKAEGAAAPAAEHLATDCSGGRKGNLVLVLATVVRFLQHGTRHNHDW